MHSIPFSKIFFRLTFALLEDTGWYQPNYEYAHEISWGRGMGCEFAQKSCMEMMERNDRHFCQDLMSAGSSKTTCTFDSTGTCTTTGAQNVFLLHYFSIFSQL